MRSEPASLPAATWERYCDNLARHLIGVSRDLETRVSRALREDFGHQDLRPSFGPLLSLIWDEGRPLSALADELAISKQACSQLATLVEAAGYLERRPNPEDGRSKVVVLTRRGRALVEEAVRIILESEAEYAALVGRGAYRSFTRALAELFEGLGIPTHADPSLTARARRSVGVLPLIAVRIQRELMDATLARGHPGLKMSYGQVLPLIGPAGGRIHEIARIQCVSRQAISSISRELEDLGYLRREPDADDRRAVRLVLTERGATLITDSVGALDALEDSLRDILGGERLRKLRDVARGIYRALHLEDEVFERTTPAAEEPVASSGAHIEQLAERLRQKLGSRDAARLASLLDGSAVGGGS